MVTTFAWHSTLTLLFQTTTFATTAQIRQPDSYLVHADKAPDSIGGLRANRSLSLIYRQMASLGGSSDLTVHAAPGFFVCGKHSKRLEKVITPCDRGYRR
jgi:hypothetical protein